MKRLLTINAIEGGYIWVTEGTHGAKYAFSKTIPEAVEASNKVLGGIEPATPPVVLESPELSLFRMGNGFAVMKQEHNKLGMEIVTVLPLDAPLETIASTLSGIMDAERANLEHRRVHEAEGKENGSNVVAFPNRKEGADDEPAN